MIRKKHLSETLIFILLAVLILSLLITGAAASFFYTNRQTENKSIYFPHYLLLESERDEGAHLDLKTADRGVIDYRGGPLPVGTEYKDKMYTFKTVFQLPDTADETDWALYAGLFEYPYRLYLNGYEIYKKGCYLSSRYNSSLRMVNSVYLSPDLLKKNALNELVLEIYPAYETWGLDTLYIDSRAAVAKAVFIRNFIGVHFLQGAFVLSLVIGIYFITLFLVIKGNTKKYIYFAFFAFFFCSVYFNVVSYYESNNEIVLESLSKSSMILLSASLLFFIREFTKLLYGKKLFWGFILFSSLMGFVFVFCQNDKESLLRVFGYFLNFMIIPQMLVASGMILYYGIKMKGAFFWPILISFSIIILTMIHDAYYFINMMLPYAWMMTYGFFAMVVGIFVSLVEEQSSIYKTSIQQARDLEVKQNSNEKLNRKLIQLNNNLESLVEEKTADLKNTIELLNYEIRERENVSEQLRQQASTDSLTGILNRNYGISFLEKQMALIKRRGSRLVVCFIDLNDLKMVNDTLGHKWGDVFITDTARLITSILRDSDVLCRLGGDEYMAILSDTSMDEAVIIFKRVLALVDEYNSNEENPYTLSFSFGFAEYGDPWIIQSQELIEKADQEMYKAKQQYRKKRTGS